MKKNYALAGLFLALLMLSSGCDRPSLTDSDSKLPSNYEKVTIGMTTAQVEEIMGAPTTKESKDLPTFKRTVYRYEMEGGANYAQFTFKNDELEAKDGNLAEKR